MSQQPGKIDTHKQMWVLSVCCFVVDETKNHGLVGSYVLCSTSLIGELKNPFHDYLLSYVLQHQTAVSRIFAGLPSASN